MTVLDNTEAEFLTPDANLAIDGNPSRSLKPHAHPSPSPSAASGCCRLPIGTLTVASQHCRCHAVE